MELLWVKRDVLLVLLGVRCRKCDARSNKKTEKVRKGVNHKRQNETKFKFTRGRKPTFSISSQFVTMPCSMGYFKVRIPLLLWASSPTYESFWPIPTITPWWRGRPTMEGKTALGASSPAKPALHIPDPLSTTKAATSSSIFDKFLSVFYKSIRVQLNFWVRPSTSETELINFAQFKCF